MTITDQINQIAQARRLRKSGNPLAALRVLMQDSEPSVEDQIAMGWDKEICIHMPDDPDVTQCHFCGYEIQL